MIFAGLPGESGGWGGMGDPLRFILKKRFIGVLGEKVTNVVDGPTVSERDISFVELDGGRVHLSQPRPCVPWRVNL